jgi:formate dehydrogenase subunit gamma
MPGSPEDAGSPLSPSLEGKAARGLGDDDILRFGPGSRLLHWAHAAPFLFLLLSGLILFLPSLKAVHIGGFRLVPLLHVLVGIAFILSPIPLALALKSEVATRADLRGLFKPDKADMPWLRYAVGSVLGARVRPPAVPKFNFGQKANTLFTVLITAGLMLTGAVLAVNFFTKRIFPALFVEQVFPIHDLLMLIAIPVVLVHIYLGSLNPGTRESLRGIIGGRVKRNWAQSHHALWLSEIDGQAAPNQEIDKAR